MVLPDKFKLAAVYSIQHEQAKIKLVPVGKNGGSIAFIGDNASPEYLFKTIKVELIWRVRFEAHFDAEREVFGYIMTSTT